ncbi:unnamed protein product [Sympodiomycopsis kandeliae]
MSSYHYPSSSSDEEQDEIGKRKRKRNTMQMEEDGVEITKGMFRPQMFVPSKQQHQEDDQDDSMDRGGIGSASRSGIGSRGGIGSAPSFTPASESTVDESRAGIGTAPSFTPASHESSDGSRRGIGSGLGSRSGSRSAPTFTPSTSVNPSTMDASTSSNRAGIGSSTIDDTSSNRAGIGSGSRREDDSDAVTYSAPTLTPAGIGSRAGFGSQHTLSSEATATFTPSGSRAGIGSQNGITSESTPASFLAGSSNDGPKSGILGPDSSALDSSKTLPTSFGRPVVTPSNAFSEERKPSTTKRSYLPTSTPQTSIKFGQGLGGGFNPAAYLASMGWTGGGLGSEGQGMLNPIEVQVRPERAGIAFGGRKEKTKQAKDEAKRRGEDVSGSEEDSNNDDDEDQSRRRRGTKQKQEKKSLRSEWTHTRKPRKPKIEHRSYEEIISSAEHQQRPAVTEQIIDARGKKITRVTSLSHALSNHPVPTSDTTQLPELRHNLRLIADNARSSLDALAKEGAGIVERRRWAKRELEEASRRAKKEEEEIAKLQVVLALTQRIDAKGKQAITGEDVGLEEAFGDLVIGKDGVQAKHSREEIAAYSLDEALVGAMAPLYKRLMANWQPLKEPRYLLEVFKSWRIVLRLGANQGQPSDALAERSGYIPQTRTKSTTSSRAMLPAESLLWHCWMPRVRSALNNDWRPHHPSAAITLLSSWRPILPRYMWDNILDQILLPKLKRTVSEWDPRRSKYSLHHILFGWLPVLNDRMDDLLSEGKTALREMVKSHRVGKESDASQLIKDISPWKEFYSKSEWDSLLLTTLVAKLSSYLKQHLSINPSNQSILPLDLLFGSYNTILKDSFMSKLLQETFFPKWLETLHTWLIQPQVNTSEIAKWYTWWKTYLDDKLSGRKELPAVKEGFKIGIQLINDAISIDASDRKRKLVKPIYKPQSTNTVPIKSIPPPQSSAEEISLKSILESKASSQNLLLFTSNRLHSTTGSKMYNLSSSTTGKGGATTFYIEDDVIWVEEKDVTSGRVDYRPVSIDEVIQIADNSIRGKK